MQFNDYHETRSIYQSKTKYAPPNMNSERWILIRSDAAALVSHEPSYTAALGGGGEEEIKKKKKAKIEWEFKRRKK